MCETACSIGKEGTINRARSRIRILRKEVLHIAPKVCIQCRKPLCVESCPVQALSQRGRVVRIDETLCNGCGECVKVCDKLFLSPEGDRAVMCDQCGKCVPVCPEKALRIS